MEIERVTSARAVDPAFAAWAAAVEAVNTEAAPVARDPSTTPPGSVASLTHGDAVQVQAGLDPSLPLGEPAPPGADTDAGREASSLQSNWRAYPLATELPRGPGPDAVHLMTPQAGRVVADALLVPALLSGLHTEAAATWPLPHPTTPEAVARFVVARRDEPPPRHDEHRDQPAPAPDEDAAPEPTERRHDSSRPDPMFDVAADGAWSDALTSALRRALAQFTPPSALVVAAEQWRRGRCVVLACPQGPDPAGLAWAFVLWPRPGVSGQDVPDLSGLRVHARLQWRQLPPSPWCHVRALKEHHPRHGRRLVASGVDASRSDLTVPCEVQLGPVASAPPHRCEVRVLIQAAQRFWAALGRQWSVHVVVGARPLLAVRDMPREV
jgi:hypothetical protein